MAWNHTKKSKKAKQKKIMKKIFGKSLPLVSTLLLLICIAFSLLYTQCEPVRDFVGDLGIFTEQTTTRPYIDPEGSEMAVHFIDVGQGDCTLLQTPQGSVLIDCSEPEYGEDIIAYLKSVGVNELEYFIITHPDEDHMGAAAYILNNFKVNYFVLNGKSKNTKFFSNALDAVEKNDIPMLEALPKDVYTVGALRMEILGPYTDNIEKMSSNDSSLIIHATYGKRVFLFTGDAEDEGEEILLNHHRNDIDCDVFSAGHHGSKTSNSLELLQAATPTYVVISCGKDNDYGHPHAKAMDNFAKVGATIYRTDELGTIVFVTDGETLEKK